MPCAIGSTPCVAQSSAPAISACDIGEVPWNCDHSILYFLPRSGKRSGRRIIQYFASSAGMVQPTRMVGTSCAFATDTQALAATSNATTMRFMTDPLVTRLLAAVGGYGTTAAIRTQGAELASNSSCLTPGNMPVN